jgi:hypothetical protein
VYVTIRGCGAQGPQAQGSDAPAAVAVLHRRRLQLTLVDGSFCSIVTMETRRLLCVTDLCFSLLAFVLVFVFVFV